MRREIPKETKVFGMLGGKIYFKYLKCIKDYFHILTYANYIIDI